MNSCPQCRREVPDDAKQCPDCGVPITSRLPVSEGWAETRPPLTSQPSQIIPVPPRRPNGFVRFCLAVAAIVSLIECISIPFIAIFFFLVYQRSAEATGFDFAPIIAAFGFPLSFFLCVAQWAVFKKVRVLYET